MYQKIRRYWSQNLRVIIFVYIIRFLSHSFWSHISRLTGIQNNQDT